MADITYPYTPADGTVLDADQLADMVYRRQHTAESLAAYNGRLEKTNMAGGGFTIEREVVRPETYSQAQMYGATLNTDYFSDPFFTGIDLADESTSSGYPRQMVGAAGCAGSWHLKRTAKALCFFWNFTSLVDTDFYTEKPLAAAQSYVVGGASVMEVGARAALYINGRRIQETDIRLKKGSTTMVDSDDPDDPFWTFDNYLPDMRQYSGFLVVDPTFVGAAEGPAWSSDEYPLTPGWHDAAIMVATDQPQVRLQVKRFGVIALY